MQNSKIEWTDATWNPLRGCTRISEGCRNCYAEAMAARFSKPGQAYAGLAEMRNGKPRWTGKMMLVEKHLEDPIRWQKPRNIFVNSMSDLFHESVPDEWIDKVFAVMARSPQHTFQILTKRADRMKEYTLNKETPQRICDASSVDEGKLRRALKASPLNGQFPLPNVWLGVSVEDQESFEKRWESFQYVKAAVKFFSIEPMLGELDIRRAFQRVELRRSPGRDYAAIFSKPVHWVICGGESGNEARPMHPDWARKLRDQCNEAGVPFFFKQWGEYGETASLGFGDYPKAKEYVFPELETTARGLPIGTSMIRVGKHAAGRLLDGVEHNGMPEVTR